MVDYYALVTHLTLKAGGAVDRLSEGSSDEAVARQKRAALLAKHDANPRVEEATVKLLPFATRQAAVDAFEDANVALPQELGGPPPRSMAEISPSVSRLVAESTTHRSVRGTVEAGTSFTAVDLR
jgi:hypothetical protein